MAAHQAPPSLGFSRQEHWTGLTFPSPMHESEKWKWSRSVVSDFQRPHGLQPTRLLHPWDLPGKSTGAGCHCLVCLKLKSMFWTLRTTQPLIVRIITNRKILQGTGVPVHLTCLLRNLYAGKEATVRTGHGTTDWFQIGKGICQGSVLSSFLFNLCAVYIMQNARLDEA